MNREQGVLYLTLSAAAVASAWLHYQAGRPAPAVAADSGYDLFVTRPSWTFMDEQGRPARTLSAERLEHFPARQQSRLDRPRLDIHKTDGSHIRVTAVQGWISDGDGPILLEQAVRVTRTAGKRNPYETSSNDH